MSDAEILEQGDERRIGGAEKMRARLVRQKRPHSKTQSDEIVRYDRARNLCVNCQSHRRLRLNQPRQQTAGTNQTGEYLHKLGPTSEVRLDDAFILQVQL